jgi:hypothetical protein
LSLVAVERVRKVSPLARSRNTIGAYAGWISDFMVNLGDVKREKFVGRTAKEQL